jgi:hypothetical protein
VKREVEAPEGDSAASWPGWTWCREEFEVARYGGEGA